MADEPARAPAAAETPAGAARVVAASAPAPAPVDPNFTVRRILDIPGPLKMGEHHWDESGAPVDGPIVITVDLEAGVLSIFRGGYEIGASAAAGARAGSSATSKPTTRSAAPASNEVPIRAAKVLPAIILLQPI